MIAWKPPRLAARRRFLRSTILGPRIAWTLPSSACTITATFRTIGIFVKAELHSAEEFRLAALRGYGILDTPREADFDEVVQVASAVCGTPISVINLIDQGRQWFKAEVGLGVRETPIDSSICAHAILQPDLFVVPDTTLDPRFCDNPLVTGQPGLRFYAGALLETPSGFPLGTVCVLDYKPRDLDETQKAFLRLMANQVMKLLELRRIAAAEQDARLHAERLVEEKATLMREGDHRLMNSLQLVQSMLAPQSRGSPNDETKKQLDMASNRFLAIATVHKQLHLTGSTKPSTSPGFWDDFARASNTPPRRRSTRLISPRTRYSWVRMQQAASASSSPNW
jgi:Histidine kinase/GAF domain